MTLSRASAGPARIANDLAEARELLEARVAMSPRAATFALTFPAKAVAAERLLRALPEDEAFVFAPAGGRAMATLGVAARVNVSGRGEDLARARAELARLFSDLEHETAGGALEVTPRAVLGLAFEPGQGERGPFAELGAGAMLLPRWTYWVEGERAALSFILAPGERPDPARALRELDAILAELEGSAQPAARPAVAECAPLGADGWAELVERIKAEIRAGRAAKIVAARRAHVRAEAPLDPVALFERMGEATEGATRYLVRRGRAAFVGCTPERLFTKRGTALETEALAGSIGAGEEDGEARLAASEKDLGEHARVVEHLVERLGPLSVRLEAAPSPHIRRFPTVLHLRTPVAAELSPKVDAFALIEALHPTPAVGGVPADVARRFIAEHEPDRGWYAAPLGFVDARGDAELFVALRCVLLSGADAWLFAGAGIVAASEAASEWEETALKMRPMQRALGIAGA